jgi:H/ACA ribonucleoprotein complex subunit 1
MSGRGGYGSRGGSRGGYGGGRGGYGGGRGGYNRGGYEEQSPDQIEPLGTFAHACEGDMVCKSTNEKVPYFNAPVYLENKTQIGRVDEILGPINQVVPNQLLFR